VHLIANSFGASDWPPEDLSDLVIKHYVGPSRLFSSFLGVELALKRSLKKLLDDLMAVHFKLLCLQATWRALTDKNWANRTLNLGLSKRRR
jgi:hypothetical protein